MEAPIFLLCLLIGGSFAFFCDDIDCDGTSLNELALLNYRPNATELIRLCPPTLEYFRCYFKGVNDCLGIDVEQLVATGDEFSKAIATPILNGRNLAVEMCDEHSTLRRDYLANLDCYKGLIADATSTCGGKADSDAEAFLRKYHNLPENERVDWGEQACLSILHGLACIAEKVENSCGETARKTFLIIVEKVKFSIVSECNVEDTRSFKRSFLEFLKLEGKRAELYEFVFERFSRR
ncbi:uncharacterized protein LOC129985289 isoform X2 [Argiope bruennichi]|nr:uncharacterized protein LOC129985289 isoform X2 [Argiope bruennichi]